MVSYQLQGSVLKLFCVDIHDAWQGSAFHRLAIVFVYETCTIYHIFHWPYKYPFNNSTIPKNSCINERRFNSDRLSQTLVENLFSIAAFAFICECRLCENFAALRYSYLCWHKLLVVSLYSGLTFAK